MIPGNDSDFGDHDLIDQSNTTTGIAKTDSYDGGSSGRSYVV